jgi:hypothetical protein
MINHLLTTEKLYDLVLFLDYTVLFPLTKFDLVIAVEL